MLPLIIAINSYCQTDRALSAFVSFQVDATQYDRTISNNAAGFGAGLQLYVRTRTWIRPAIDVSADIFGGTKELRVTDDGKPVYAKDGVTNVYTGAYFQPGRRFFASLTAGPSSFYCNRMQSIFNFLRHPRQQFLFCPHNLPLSKCYLYLLFVQVMVYMPALIYSMVVAVIALRANYIASFAGVMLFNTLIVGATPMLYLVALQRRSLFSKAIPLPRIGIRIGKPLFSVPLYYIWHSRKQMLFMSKLFSLLLLFAFIKLYEPDHYDIRPMLLCFILAVATNSAIVYEMKNFEDFFCCTCAIFS